MSNKQSAKRLSSLKGQRLKRLSSPRCQQANDKSATIVQKLSKLFDNDENAKDKEIQKESTKVQSNKNKIEHSNEQRRPFGDITQLHQFQDTCNPISKEHLHETKNKLAELEYSSPRKPLKTQVLEKREQMLQLQNKVQMMYEELMSTGDSEKLEMRQMQEKYENYMKNRKELIEISSAFESLQAQCVNAMYQKVVVHLTDPINCPSEPDHHTQSNISSQESQNQTRDINTCVKSEKNVQMTEQVASESSIAIGDNDTKENRELTTTSKIGSGTLTDCCNSNLVVTDETNYNDIGSSIKEQVQDEKESEKTSRMSVMQSCEISCTISNDDDTKVNDGMKTRVTSGCDGQESINAIMNKLQPTTETMEKSNDEETMMFAQPISSPQKGDEPLTAHNLTSLQKSDQLCLKKAKSMDKWQVAKDRVQKSSSPLMIKSSIEKLSFSNLKKFDKSSNTPATGRSLSYSRKSSGRWSNRSHTPLERQDTPVVQKSHGKYFRPGPCEVTLPSIGEHKPSASNLMSPSAQPKVNNETEARLTNDRKLPAKKLAESIGSYSNKSTPTIGRNMTYGKRRAGYSSIKSKIDSGLKRLPGKTPLKLQELQSPIANDGDDTASPLKKPVKRALSCIADDEPEDAAEEFKRRRTVDDQNFEADF